VLSALLTLMSFLGVSVGEAYLTLLDLAVILQLLPSCYLFSSLLKHTLDGRSPLNASKPYLLANGIGGLLATTVGLIVAFIPSRQVNSIWLYEIKLIAGCVLVFGSAYLFYRNAQKTAPQLDPVAATALSGSGE
jgi:glutamate:GABA antiporter